MDLGSPSLAPHCSPRALLQNRNLNADSPERRRRPGHGSLTNISRHDSLKKIDSPPIRRSTSSGQYTGFNDHKPLDPESIAQVCVFFIYGTVWFSGQQISLNSTIQSTCTGRKVCAGEYPTWLSKQGVCEGRCIKQSWIEEAQRGVNIAEAIKRNYFPLHCNEIASAIQNTRMVLQQLRRWLCSAEGWPILTCM